MTYSFESPKVFDRLLLPADSPLRNAIEIMNPLGEDYSIMRTSFAERNAHFSGYELQQKEQGCPAVRAGQHLHPEGAAADGASG